MWRHWGHKLRAGSERVQAEARRLRLLALEVFFLGTAMMVSSLVSGALGIWGHWLGIWGHWLGLRPVGWDKLSDQTD